MRYRPASICPGAKPPWSDEPVEERGTGLAGLSAWGVGALGCFAAALARNARVMDPGESSVAASLAVFAESPPPQDGQNRLPAGASLWHAGQRIGVKGNGSRAMRTEWETLEVRRTRGTISPHHPITPSPHHSFSTTSSYTAGRTMNPDGSAEKARHAAMNSSASRWVRWPLATSLGM